MTAKKFNIHKLLPYAETSILTLLVVAGAFVYGVLYINKNVRTLKDEQAKTAVTITGLENKIILLESTLTGTTKNAEDLSFALNNTVNKNTVLESQLSTITSTVGTLEKLSFADEELLKKYSKVYFLNEHYVPISLTKIEPDYLYEPSRGLEIHSNVWPFLEELIDDANKDGGNLRVGSAYRSFGTQAVLKSSYRVTYGAGTANSFSAEQGYSEHQLGTTIDFTTTGISGQLNGFDATREYEWLLENGHKYGFIVSYPKDNIFYKYEPWHWRFVGVKLASDLHEQNIHFYDMDQRVIDTYLAYIFDR